MNRIVPIFLLLIAMAFGAAAQNTPPAQSDETSKAAKQDDISGMYSFEKDGEFVQINQEEDGIISGFVSRFGDDVTDKKTFLDQFFSKAALNGKTLTFATKVIHGTWFEFKGKVTRASGKTPGAEGYHLLRGKLTQYVTDAGKTTSPKTRDVEFKSFPADAQAPKP